MEHIMYLHENGLIWDNKYFDIEFNPSRDELRENFDAYKQVMIYIMRGISNKTIDTRFYYLGRKFVDRVRFYISTWEPGAKMFYDLFRKIEDIEQSHIDFPVTILGHNVRDINEYIVLSRGVIQFDIDPCELILHKIDINSTEIIEYYNLVKDYLDTRHKTGLNTKSARNIK